MPHENARAYHTVETLGNGAVVRIRAVRLVTLLRQIHDEIDAAVLSAYGWDELRRADISVRLDAASDAQDRGTGIVAKRRWQAEGRPEGEQSSAMSRLLTETFEEEILTRLVALNHERTAEEKRGLVRWLRPEYQCPSATSAPVEEQSEIDLDNPVAKTQGGSTERSEVKLVRVSTAPASTSALTWPDKLPEQVTRIRALVPELGTDPAALSARFGRANKKREEQIEAILETLRGLGL